MASTALSTRFSTACFNSARSTYTSGTSIGKSCATYIFAFCNCGLAISITSFKTSASCVASRRTSMGRVKSRKRLTTASRRSISLSSTCTACCEPLADLQLCVDAFDGVEVAQGHQRAHALAVFLNRLHTHANSSGSTDGVQVRFCGDLAQFVALHVQDFVQRMPERENFVHAPTQKVPGGRAEKFLRRRADHHGARIAGEEQQAVLQPGHYRIHVLAQGAEDFVDAAQLLPDLRNFSAHLPKLIGTAGKCLGVPGRGIVLSGGNAIQLG